MLGPGPALAAPKSDRSLPGSSKPTPLGAPSPPPEAAWDTRGSKGGLRGASWRGFGGRQWFISGSILGCNVGSIPARFGASKLVRYRARFGALAHLGSNLAAFLDDTRFETL